MSFRRAVLSSVAVVAFVSLLSPARTGAADSFENTIVGERVPPGSSSLRIEGAATGAVPGDYSLSLLTTDSVVDGGTWYLVVQREADGELRQVGRLRGRISSGSLELGADGSVAKVNVLALTIDSGTGEFSGVTSGSAVVDGAFEGAQFAGNFNLTF